MIEVVEYVKELHELTIQRWFEHYGWDGSVMSIVSDEGYVAIDDLDPVAAAWVYRVENAPVAYIEWLIGNPDAGDRTKLEGVRGVLDTCKESCLNSDIRFIIGSSQNEAILKRLESNGYATLGSQYTHFVYHGES